MPTVNCTSLCGVACESFVVWDKRLTPCGELMVVGALTLPYLFTNIYYLTLLIFHRRQRRTNDNLEAISNYLKISTFSLWPIVFIVELIYILATNQISNVLPYATVFSLALETVITGSHLSVLITTKVLLSRKKWIMVMFSLLNSSFIALQFYDNIVMFKSYNAISIGHVIILGSHSIYLAALIIDFISWCRRRADDADGRSLDNEEEQENLYSTEGTLGLNDGDQYANCLSKLTFWWTNGLMKNGYLGLLTSTEALFRLPNRLNIEYLLEKVQTKSDQISKSASQRKFGLLKIFNSTFGWEFYSLGVLKFFADALNFVGPLLLSYLITFMESPDEPNYLGYLYAFGMFSASFLSSTFAVHYNYKMNVVGLKIRGSLIGLIYGKLLKIPLVELSKFSTGNIMNFAGTDSERVVNFVRSFHEFWTLPMQIGIALYLLYREVELAFLAGLAFAILVIPVNRWIAVKIGSLSTDMMFYKDQRIKTVSEMLHGVRNVKFCAWETYFRSVIENKRSNEIQYLKGRKYLDAICVYLWASAPIVVAILTFTTYILMGNQLTAAKLCQFAVFTSLALFNILIVPLNAFPWVVSGVVESYVSLKRLQAFFDLKDFDPSSYFVEHCEFHPSSEICVHNASFSWLPDVSSASATLNDANLDLKKGRLIGVIGSVGSGKSSLFSAILGEMKRLTGTVYVRNNVDGLAYVSQEAWLQHGTVRSNILFGRPYRAEIYEAVVSACALLVDFQQMPFGDATEVGEQGVTLSGGQKTRIALARAVYQDKDIYLLDDPLSAVDAQVARHIFENCIRRLLANKLVILATHGIQFLKKADQIFVISGGKIIAEGLPNEILSNYTLLNETAVPVDSPTSEKNANDDENNDNASNVGGGEPTLMRDEERESGSVKAGVYIVYFVAVGTCLSSIIFAAFFLMQTTKNLSDWWLSYWVENTPDNNTNTSYLYSDSYLSKHMNIFSHLKYPYHAFVNVHYGSHYKQQSHDVANDFRFYLMVYGILAGVNSVFTLVRAFSFAYGGICSAKNLHNTLLDTILKAPVRFFDVTPIGRIVNRFSTDCYSIDDSLPFQANRFVTYIFAVLGTVVMTVYGIPWFALCILPMVALYYYIQKYYRRTTCELKRLNSVTLSPIFSHFTDTLNGVSIIRAFRKTNEFTLAFVRILTENQRAQFSLLACSSWLGVRLQMMGVLMIASVATIAVVEHQFRAVNAGLVGLAISYALSITNLLSGLLQSFTETEKEMVAVERVSQYVKNVPSEKWVGIVKCIAGWPSSGKIEFLDVSLQYSSDLPLALDHINFTVNAGEKVGIVGRTGSGKSSIFQAFFRTVELNSGRILVDDQDISFLNLSELRSNLSIIPQHPFLFSGSLRQNLDVYDKYSDAQILSVIEACGLATLVQRLGNLNAEVGEKGGNLSMGERQLVCLARALLVGPKVLCIDEATAHVDLDTDIQIQRTLRDSFERATVLTIAHRINTILDYDRVIVMEQGKIVEFDSPRKLLSNSSSKFYFFAKDV